LHEKINIAKARKTIAMAGLYLLFKFNMH